jgi:hypothetical protein
MDFFVSLLWLIGILGWKLSNYCNIFLAGIYTQSVEAICVISRSNFKGKLSPGSKTYFSHSSQKSSNVLDLNNMLNSVVKQPSFFDIEFENCLILSCSLENNTLLNNNGAPWCATDVSSIHFDILSNLSTTTTLGTTELSSLLTSGRSSEVPLYYDC